MSGARLATRRFRLGEPLGGDRGRASGEGRRRGAPAAVPDRSQGAREPAGVRRALPALVLAAALIGGWELYVRLSGIEPALLPAPHAVATALWDNRGLLLANFLVTAEEVVLGLALALACGFMTAIAIHVFPLLRRAVYPLLVASQAVPIPVVGVLLVFWWGFGIFPKLAVIALICFFPVVVTTVDALAGADADQGKLLRTLDATRWQALRFAELPAALPGALSGARIALAVGVIGAFIAETTTPSLGAHPGLGREIMNDVNFQTARAYAGTAILIAFAVGCFYSLALAERRLAPCCAPRGGRPR